MVLYKKTLIYVDNIDQRFCTKTLRILIYVDNIDKQFCTKNTDVNHSLQEDVLNSPIEHLL